MDRRERRSAAPLAQHQSYRALGKARVDAATDDELIGWLAADGKLVKRPVLVRDGTVLVGFRPEAWETALQG